MVPFKIFISYVLDSILGVRKAGALKIVLICIANKLFPAQTSRASTGNTIILLHHSLRNSYL